MTEYTQRTVAYWTLCSGAYHEPQLVGWSGGRPQYRKPDRGPGIEANEPHWYSASPHRVLCDHCYQHVEIIREMTVTEVPAVEPDHDTHAFAGVRDVARRSDW